MSTQQHSDIDLPERDLASWLSRVSPHAAQSINHVYGSFARQTKSGWFCWQKSVRSWSAQASVTLRVGGGEHVVWIESLTDLSSFFNGPHPHWPNQELCAVFDMAAAPMCEAIASAIGGSLVVTCVVEHDEPMLMSATEASLDYVEFSFRTPAMTKPVMGRMKIPEVALIGEVPSNQLDMRVYGDIPVRWRMAVGSIRLLAAQVEEIKSGDVLRCDAPLPRSAFAIRLISKRSPAQLVGLAQEGSIIIQRIEASTMNRAETPGEAPRTNEKVARDEAGNFPVGQIEIELSFDLGEVSFPIAEMTRVCPGYVVKLGMNVKNNVVRIRANGREIGTGGLVAVGDELAVQVTNWAYAKK